ncbi:uncharacterized protein HMF8227_00540 [Saliniradius amylolyticus]|uniref:SH3b domain-containing protein n=1 Tax=Saliniradius amylolyticus TaxID=2183582 RepID=A0A2S2E083_9ALTE|nr:TIGR04211 family SH3 domain-containing protein [Saliniradius amylolyticus]AWL11036.1 uncharacterized protein HMF8227_00540 [Saliniradius amylolyticus]
MPKLFSVYLVLALLLTAPVTLAQDGETVYVSDELYTFVHAGPGRNYRILGSVTAGTPVTLLEINESEGYSKVHDADKERTGWVKSSFISREPSLKQKLPAVQEELDIAKQALASLRQENQDLLQRRGELQRYNAELEASLEQSQEKLEEALSQLEDIDNQVQIAWMTRGGVIAFVGLLVGVIIMLLPRKRQRRDQWM